MPNSTTANPVETNKNHHLVRIEGDTCSTCGATGHNPKASFCYGCGGKITNPGEPNHGE